MKRATQKLPTGNANSNAQLRWQICPQHPACLKSPQIQQFTSSQRVCLLIVTSHGNLSLHQPPSPQHPEAISLQHLGIPVGIIFRAILANLEELPIGLQGDLFLFHTYTKWQGKWDGIFNGFFPRKNPTPKLWEKNVANCDTSWIEVTIGCQLHGDANLQIGGTTLHVQLPRPGFFFCSTSNKCLAPMCGGSTSQMPVEHLQNGHLFMSAERKQFWMLREKPNGFAQLHRRMPPCACTACTRQVRFRL